jgi:hypothetical protein
MGRPRDRVRVSRWAFDRDRALADLGLAPDTGTEHRLLGEASRPQRLVVIKIGADARNLAVAKVDDCP